MEDRHDPLQCVTQLRQTLAADKLSVGFFLGAGCPCSIRVPGLTEGSFRPLIPDIKGITLDVSKKVSDSPENGEAFKKLAQILKTDGDDEPTIETMLNRTRMLRNVAGKSTVRDLSFDELDSLDQEICKVIKEAATCDLPTDATPYHALARFIRTHRFPISELFTTNYDVLMEQALEFCRVPYFDGFVGSCRPFFDQRAIEDDRIPARWSRLWKLHGSINWRFHRPTKTVFRSSDVRDGDELLIHPSHLKYDESRRMPYFVMIDRLRDFLRNNEKPVALLVIGYSFADEHINEAIMESLKVNASAACFALQFGELAEYPRAKGLAEDIPNLSLFAADAGIIRRREAKWIAQPATDMSALRCAFEAVKLSTATSEGENGARESEQSDAPKPCRFIAGNFENFGAFLDEFSRYGTYSSSSLSQ